MNVLPMYINPSILSSSLVYCAPTLASSDFKISGLLFQKRTIVPIQYLRIRFCSLMSLSDAK